MLDFFFWKEVLFAGKQKVTVKWTCAGVRDPAAQGIKLGALVGEAAKPTRINVRTSTSDRLLTKGNLTSNGRGSWKGVLARAKKKKKEKREKKERVEVKKEEKRR